MNPVKTVAGAYVKVLRYPFDKLLGSRARGPRRPTSCARRPRRRARGPSSRPHAASRARGAPPRSARRPCARRSARAG